MRLALKARFPALSRKKLARLLKLFRSHFKDSRRLMGLALLCGLGATAMRLLKPWPLKLLFDGVLIPNEAVRSQPLFAPLLSREVGVVVATVCLALLVISMLWGLLASRQTFLTAQAGQKVVYGLRRRATAAPSGHVQRGEPGLAAGGRGREAPRAFSCVALQKVRRYNAV